MTLSFDYISPSQELCRELVIQFWGGVVLKLFPENMCKSEWAEWEDLSSMRGHQPIILEPQKGRKEEIFSFYFRTGIPFLS